MAPKQMYTLGQFGISNLTQTFSISDWRDDLPYGDKHTSTLTIGPITAVNLIILFIINKRGRVSDFPHCPASQVSVAYAMSKRLSQTMSGLCVSRLVLEILLFWK